MYRNKIADPRWRNAWDWALLVGGAVPALLFGVAFGNLFLGLPFHFDELQRPVSTGGFFGLLHPFALLAGVVSLSMLIMHGSVYAALKVGEPMSVRAAAVGRAAGVVYAISFIAAGVWIATTMAGHRIMSEVNSIGPSNPLTKHVAVIQERGSGISGARELVAGARDRAARGRGDLDPARQASAWRRLPVELPDAGRDHLTAGIALFPFLMPSSARPTTG